MKYFTTQQVAEISGKSLWVDARDFGEVIIGIKKVLKYFTARQVCEIGNPNTNWLDLNDVKQFQQRKV